MYNAVSPDGVAVLALGHGGGVRGGRVGAGLPGLVPHGLAVGGVLLRLQPAHPAPAARAAVGGPGPPRHLELAVVRVWQLPLRLRPMLLGLLQRHHTRPAHHPRTAADHVVRVVVGANLCQNVISNGVQFSEFLLVTSFAIPLPGIGSLPGTDPADEIHELIMGAHIVCSENIIIKIIFPNNV